MCPYPPSSSGVNASEIEEKEDAIYTYTHACMHTHIHTYIHIYIHTYIGVTGSVIGEKEKDQVSGVNGTAIVEEEDSYGVNGTFNGTEEMGGAGGWGEGGGGRGSGDPEKNAIIQSFSL